MGRCLETLSVLFFYILTLVVVQETHSLHLTSEKISVELYKDVDSNKTDAQLVCHYNLDDDLLYSINWYKNSREFYRFTQSEIPQAKEFKGKGINVQMSKSNATVVFLQSIDKSSAGSYRCDVTGDYPSFTYVFQETNLNF